MNINYFDYFRLLGYYKTTKSRRNFTPFKGSRFILKPGECECSFDIIDTEKSNRVLTYTNEGFGYPREFIDNINIEYIPMFTATISDIEQNYINGLNDYTDYYRPPLWIGYTNKYQATGYDEVMTTSPEAIKFLSTYQSDNLTYKYDTASHYLAMIEKINKLDVSDTSPVPDQLKNPVAQFRAFESKNLTIYRYLRDNNLLDLLKSVV